MVLITIARCPEESFDAIRKLSGEKKVYYLQELEITQQHPGRTLRSQVERETRGPNDQLRKSVKISKPKEPQCRKVTWLFIQLHG